MSFPSSLRRAQSCLSATARARIVYAINTTIASANPTGNPAQSDTISGSITTDGTVTTAVPEPASFALLAAGLAGIVAIRRRETL